MKFRKFGTSALAIVAVVTLSFANAVSAADNPNLLVMVEDYDKDAVPRNSRVDTRVWDSVQSELNVRDFNVYDETAVSMGDFTPGRARRPNSELIDIAKSILRPPIDIVATYQIYASAKQLEYTTKIRVRIRGRLLNVKSGKFLDNFEVELPEPVNAPQKCNRECILEEVGGEAKFLGAELGSVLAEKLDWLVNGESIGSGGGESQLITGYNLVFEGFTPEEYMEIEDYLVIFSGYESHRPGTMSARRAQVWYESSIRTAKLSRNLQKMLPEIGQRGTVSFTGNTFVVRKISLRNKGNKPIASEW